jgi:hypothetical protein
MKKPILVLFFALFSVASFGQSQIEAKELTKKELRELKRQKAFEKQKSRYAKRIVFKRPSLPLVGC